MESIWKKQFGNSGNSCASGCISESMMKEHSECSHVNLKSSGAAENRHWDVIVVGAGMAGVLIGWYLQREGKNVLILEGSTVASGQTQSTTAKITSQHDLKYHRLICTVGRKKAALYAQANEQAIQEYETLIERRQIDCDFERVPAYLYSKDNETQLQKEAQASASLGIKAFFTRETELPFPVAGAVCFENQAQFSPLKFLLSLAQELDVREHSEVLAVKRHQVRTKDAVFTADKIVIATHYPLCNVPGFYFLRQHQERSHVIALTGTRRIKGMYLGVDPNGLSLRQAGEYLLLGGKSKRTGENQAGGAYEFLRNAAFQYFPEAQEAIHWSAQDCMPHDGIPFIGRYSIFTPNLYVATGFQKWGMTTSMIAALLLRDEILGRENPYRRVFHPQRLHIRASFVNLVKDVWISICGLVKGFFCLFHKKSPRCSHMGCALTWNPDEQSWDCPCHGSRFDLDGKLIDNPAKKDA